MQPLVSNSNVPRYITRDGGIPIEFELTLKALGDIPPGTKVKASFDTSSQYRTEGTCWRTTTSSNYFRAGERIEKNWVSSFSEIP